MSLTSSDKELAAAIVRFKASSALVEQFSKGDATVDVVGASGTYPSLAKLAVSVQTQMDTLRNALGIIPTVGMTIPSGPTTKRDATPVPGRFRYDSTTGRFEGFTARGWSRIDNAILALYSGAVGVAQGTTIIPLDNTPPLPTEGTELWSVTLTPKAVGSVMEIDFSTMVDTSSAGAAVTLSLYRDNILIGFCTVGGLLVAVSGLLAIATVTPRPHMARLHVLDPVTALTPVKYSCRIGVESAGTWYLGRGSNANMGGVNSSAWTIRETLA